MTALEFSLRIRTKNEQNFPTGNSKMAAIIRTRRHARERELAQWTATGAMLTAGLKPTDLVPCRVTFIRESSSKMDDDGLAGSIKHIRDGIAKALGINDGGRFVRWKYTQAKCAPKSFALRVRIEAGEERCEWCSQAPATESCDRLAGRLCKRCHAAKRVSYPCKCMTLLQACEVLNIAEAGA